ncbi:MAG: GTP-binding protein [Candidatus Parvarchaeota archaeon]|nr:GTP-binding protein [Candidatus Parvarchaeota archaeon]
MDKVKDPVFGIGKLDDDLTGIPDKKSVLFFASPAVGNEVFGYQVIHNNLLHGNKVLLYVNRTSPEAYLADMKDYDFEVNSNLHIIDSYSGITGISSKSVDDSTMISNPYDKEEIKKALSEELDKGYDLLVIDSLSLIADFFDFDYAMSVIDLVKDKLDKKGGSVLSLFTDWDYGEENLNKLISKVNAKVDIKGIEKRVIFGQYFAVIKCDWVKDKKFSSVLFKAVKPGGIKIYFPKILVTGPTDAGKTSFIHSASKDAVSVDRLGGTIALDHGNLDFKGYKADLFGTPGQERFDPLLKLLGGEAVGVILVIDSTKPDQFPRAIEMLRKTETYGLPIVVVANKADLPGALSLDDIREHLHLDKNTSLVRTVAENLNDIDPNKPTRLKKDGVDSALDALFAELT